MMNEPILKKKKKYTNKVISGIFSLCLMIIVVGISYAFFIYNKTGLYTHTINGGKMGVSYNETTGNNITIDNAYPRTDKEALTYGLEFEFTITGYNESDVNVYYAIEMDHGADIAGKDRFLDSDMKLSLYENDEVVFENEIFNNLDNQDIHYGHISYGTSQESPVVNTYKLRIWINDNVMITNTPDTVDTTGKNVYSSEEFANHYANFKVNVKADLTYDDVGYLTYDANGGSYTPKKTSLTTGLVTTQKPVMEGKGFLGWSGTKDGEVEFKAGDVYTGDYDVLYAVYSDTRNVMSDLSAFESNRESITEVYFINDAQENIDARYNSATYKADLTYNNQGSVKGWLETDPSDTSKNILYIGSEGTIYLSTGHGLFSGFISATTIDFTVVDSHMVTDMRSMFGRYIDDTGNILTNECALLAYLDLSSFNTSNVVTMKDMFNSCVNLNGIDVSSFDTSKVTNMSGIFKDCSSLVSLDLTNFDTSSVTTMFSMFNGCAGLKSLDLSNFDTSQVTSMQSMFYECNNLVSLDLTNFDTSSVTTMFAMFYYCSSLENLDLSSFDTSKVTSMSTMFKGCSSLVSLDLANFDTSSVTTMYDMFNKCTNLRSLNLSNFDTSQVTSMRTMFYECNNLVSLDVSNFDTSKVETMYAMFYHCNSLEKLDLSSFDTSEVADMTRVFSGCSNLTTIYANSDWNTETVTVSTSMFSGCTNLVGAISFGSSKLDVTYANPDTGYFTRKTA